jgi:NitT/TauT family transport system substrate-binding protein
MDVAVSLVMRLDEGLPILVLGGVHVGCYELFGGERVRTIRDLKGRTVGVSQPDSNEKVFLTPVRRFTGCSSRRGRALP